jgi:hypothetical protein
MSSANKRHAEMIERMEHYVECWKQFNHYLTLARTKQFSQEDEEMFLDTKSVLAQELELILNDVEGSGVSREDVLALIAEAPSIRFVSELPEGGLKSLENKWHKLYIGWQSMLGQLKVAQKQLESKPRWSLFGRKK